MNEGPSPPSCHTHSADRPPGDRGALCASAVRGRGEQRGASLECARRWGLTGAQAPSQAAKGREHTPSPGLGPAPRGGGDLARDLRWAGGGRGAGPCAETPTRRAEGGTCGELRGARQGQRGP